MHLDYYLPNVPESIRAKAIKYCALMASNNPLHDTYDIDQILNLSVATLELSILAYLKFAYPIIPQDPGYGFENLRWGAAESALQTGYTPTMKEYKRK